jgi:RHS repeat-associated protein
VVPTACEPFQKNGGEVYSVSKDIQGELPYDERAKYERNPQRSTLLYTDDPELASSLLERMGAPAFDGFSPTFQHAGIDFLESVINEDLSWKTAKQINLVEAIGPPCYAVILPSDKYDSWYRYDKAGNITRLKRKQTHPTSGAWSLNQMEYSYPAGLTSNRLEKVAGPAALYSTKYSYDANGNMASDQAPGISAVSYDWRNRPTNMTTSSSTYFYRYDASGLRSYRKVQPISGPAQVEYFLPGMVLDANGAILRFDIADGFAEIDANGKMKRNHVLKDWLGTPRMTLDASGAVAQAGDYYPYGRTIDQRSYTAVTEADRFRFTGHEHDAESGYDYHGARYYQPEVGRYLGVDVMAGKRPEWTCYRYGLDNPVKFVDPTGMFESTDVEKNEDGTYTVKGGKVDGDRSIYIVVNGKRTGEKVGKSFTEFSFLNEDGNAVVGAIITPTDKSGMRFLSDEIINPPIDLGLFEYMSNATSGKSLDFKTRGQEKRPLGTTFDQYYYRGMPLGVDHFGNQDGPSTIFGSARDFGNVAAGYVAGRRGIPWFAARVAFDVLESYQQGEFSSEGQPTVRAQYIGHDVGIGAFWRAYSSELKRTRSAQAARTIPFGPK